MFTFGIFTTHLPYIALVVFYAFFWVIGVSKASAGELQPAENRISIELTAERSWTEIDPSDTNKTSIHFDQQFSIINHKVGFAALQKLRHDYFHLEQQLQSTINLTLFSRPPPFHS